MEMKQEQATCICTDSSTQKRTATMAINYTGIEPIKHIDCPELKQNRKNITDIRKKQEYMKATAGKLSATKAERDKHTWR